MACTSGVVSHGLTTRLGCCLKSSERIDTTYALTMDDEYKEMFISIGVDGVPD